MLSYLKDSHATPAGEAMENSQDGNGPQQYLTVSGHGKRVRQNTIVLGVLFAVGGFGLWLMIQKTTPKKVNAEPSQDQQQLDMALAQLNAMQSEMDNQINSVAGRFDQFSSVNQIAVDELKKNPFKREMGYGPVDSAEDTELERRKQVEVEAQRRTMGLELWSITSTPRGMCCMIGDKVFYENDEINGMKVQSITQNRVRLDYQGVPIELKMD